MGEVKEETKSISLWLCKNTKQTNKNQKKKKKRKQKNPTKTIATTNYNKNTTEVLGLYLCYCASLVLFSEKQRKT